MTRVNVELAVPPSKPAKALVLGATGGIGRAYCIELAKRELSMVICGRDKVRTSRLADELHKDYGVAVEELIVDLRHQDEVARIGEQIERDDSIRWFVNSSGIADWGHFAEITAEQHCELLQVNLVSAVQLLHRAVKSFSHRGGGTIIHVASGAAFYSVPSLATYAASKGAIVQLMRAIHRESAAYGVNIQAVCPGFVKTEMFAAAGADASRLPAAIWMRAERVARESLNALRWNQPVYIPGWRYRAMLLMTRFVPASMQCRVAGWLFGNYSKYRLQLG